MGGKTKQSQRTKNNVRPSSSSRSAELLNNSVNLDGGLVTTSSGKVVPALFPSLATSLTFNEHELNPEFQMSFKKLNKKDPITRAKGLQELCELVNNGNVDDVVAILPSWALCYKTLTADIDRRVRELTQLCHGAIVRVCGRRTAPQLKALVPPWLQAQYDEHAPAQANAQNSLKNTFPDKKLPEVISFCKAEVMTHLLENLIGNTEAIITKKIEDPEERELQMCRVITSSLRGLEYFIPNLPAQHHAWLWAELTPLLDSAAFWSFAAHNAPQVRAAWYGALGRVAERFGRAQFGPASARRATRVLLGVAREANALVAAQIWTCLLQFMHHVEDWQQYLDKKELLVKRLLDVLETGGWGDAKHLSTMLLPLLAHLPQDVKTKEFYESFFNALYKGLDKKNILSSKSERQSWITSLAECLRYLSIQQNEFVVEIATSVHRTWIEKVLDTHHDAQTRTNLIKCSSTNMTSLVKYWLKQSKEEKNEKYDQLLRNFWQNIGSTVVSQIDKCRTDLNEITSLIDGHILLLQNLKSTFLQGTKKPLSIKFDGDVPNTTETSPVVTQECDASIVDRYKHNLDELAYNICYHYLETAQKKQVSNTILIPLITLLIEFDSKDLFLALAHQFGLSSTYMLYDKVLRSWITGDTMRCKAVVDIIFLMMKHLSEEEQSAILDTFKQLTPAVVEWCLAMCVSHPYVLQAPSRRWLQASVAGDAAAGLASRALGRAGTAEDALLLACLADGPDGEALLSPCAVSRIVTTVSSALSRVLEQAEQVQQVEQVEQMEQTVQVVQVAARVVTALAAGAPQVVAQCEHFPTLVLRLFTLNILVPRGDERVPADTWCEARSSWQDGLDALGAAGARAAWLRAVAALLKDLLLQDIEDVNVNNIENIVSLCPHLFNRSVGEESDLPSDVTEMVTFTQQIFNLGLNEARQVKTCALRYECVTSRLQCLYAEENLFTHDIIESANDCDICDLPKTELVLFMKKFLFRAIYLRTLLLHESASEDDESEEKTWCDALLSDMYFAGEYLRIIHDYSVIWSVSDGYTFWLHYNIVEETKQKADVLLGEILAATSLEVREKLSLSLCRMTSTNGYFWSYAYFWYKVNAFPEWVPDKMDHHGNRLTNYGYYHVLQAKTNVLQDAELSYRSAYRMMTRSWHAAHPHMSQVQDKAELDVDVIINAYYTEQSTMLYEVDISDAPWTQVVSNVAVIEFLTLLVETRGWTATSHQWDFTTITLCSVLSSLEKSKHNWSSTKVSMFGRAALRLFGAVAQFVGALAHECERAQPAEHVAALLREWPDMFAPDTHHNIYTLILYILNTCSSTEMSVPRAEMLRALVKCTDHTRWAQLGARALGPLALGALTSRAAASLARRAHPALKYLACHLLLSLSKDLVLHDAHKIKLWSEDLDDSDEEKERPQLSLDYFHETFTQLQDIVDTALNNVVLGEEICELVPLSDSHIMTLGFLLLAEAMSTICFLGRGDLLQFYIELYRERKYVPPLLSSSLRLLPPEVFAYTQDNSGTATPASQYTDYFVEFTPFSMRTCVRDVSAAACRALFGAVGAAGGGAARGWWCAASARAGRVLERTVRAHVAPRLARDQLVLLQRRAHELPDALVRIAWSSLEVVCDLTVEETVIQLLVRLDPAHPLVPPRISVAKGPPYDTHWLALFLAYQNGTLINALKMWAQVVNARVEKSPQCYICYCRLHPATGQLPRVICHQCKNRFHNQCLRKWFTTSHKSNCPLCRANF